ncbi:MAG: hypothetical protein H6732_02460 [Alphaproteobacteria bacterium]|nr:hypothetical protein [Alphaproteobacteria bacterium]
MTPDTRDLILDRLARIRDTIDRLADTVRGAPAPSPASAPPISAPAAPAQAAAPAAPAPAPPAAPIPRDQLTIGPDEAAGILGVVRQTIDRRLKAGLTTGPGAPVDISGGTKRSRWRWASADDVRTWWSHAG